MPASLAALIGPGRARVLTLLDTPKSTTQLVALTGLGLGSAGRHLKVLLDAGLAQRRRAGRSVLYSRTPPAPPWLALSAADGVPEIAGRIRGAVSDRGRGVRSRGERPPTGGAPKEGTAIMKLTTMTQVTVDGVVQGNGGASDEDRRNGFERGGWAMGAGDDEPGR